MNVLFFPEKATRRPTRRHNANNHHSSQSHIVDYSSISAGYEPPTEFNDTPPSDFWPKPITFLVYGDEHQRILERSLKHARHEIIIVSPWIRGRSALEFAEAIPEQHEYGVRVRVYFGWQPVSKTGYYDESEIALVDLYRRLLGPDMRRVTQGTHSKILLYDRRAVLTTSWNWLSHQYRPGNNNRAEHGMFTTEPEAVRKMMAAFGIRDP